jgi:hypothetical protein
MNANETLQLISKQWCDLNELMKLTQVGKNNALKIRKELKSELEQDGYILPKNLLPMCEVVNKLKINIPYLQKMARKEL